MIASLTGPSWFLPYSIIFWIASSFVTLLISAWSYKIYKLSKQDKHFYFALGFGFISLGYVAIAVSNILLIGPVSTFVRKLFQIFDFGFLTYIILIFMGYLALSIVTLEIHMKKAIALIASLLLLLVIFSYQYTIKFHMVSFVMLFFLAMQFYQNYLKKRSFNSGLVFTSFYLMTIAQPLFILGIIYYAICGIAAHLLQIVAYMLLLWVFVRVVKNG